MSLEIVILAAGKGKRMYSRLPKVLHSLAGKPMLQWVIETAQQLNPQAIHIVYGHGGDEIKKTLANFPVNWVFQKEQLGTGHAVKQALHVISDNAQVLILSGDVPLIQTQTLHSLVHREYPNTSQQRLERVTPSSTTLQTPPPQQRDKENDVFKGNATTREPLKLLVATVDNPTGLGRIIRNNAHEICAIVEEKDASAEQKQIKEIYSGICCASATDLARWLPNLSANNAQGEYYLTEIITMAVAENLAIASMEATDTLEIQGVNTCLQLQQLERIWQQRFAEQLMLAGVTVADANRLDVRGELHCGHDVVIDINVICSGKVTLGNGSRIGPNCVLHNVTLGENCEILANSVLEDCLIDNNCHIGPFARLRPGTKLAANCKIGNFVETKNAVFNIGTKASHLSYLGDVTIGQEVNIGAGTITCNYDGVNKHQTVIEDGVFIGSDTQLIAPVRIGANATIGAGSTIRKNVPAEELTLTVSQQKTIFGWKRPVKKEKK